MTGTALHQASHLTAAIEVVLGVITATVTGHTGQTFRRPDSSMGAVRPAEVSGQQVQHGGTDVVGVPTRPSAIEAATAA